MSAWVNFAFATDVAVADAPLRPGDQIAMKLGGVPSTEISALSGYTPSIAKGASTFRTSAG